MGFWWMTAQGPRHRVPVQRVRQVRPLTARAVVTSPGWRTLALAGRHAAAVDTLLGTKRWGRGGGVTRRLHPSPPTASTLRGLPLPPPPPGTGAPTSLSQD